MSMLGTFNGYNIVALPCDTVPGVQHPSSIEWDMQEVVSANRSPFTGQTQTYDWQNSVNQILLPGRDAPKIWRERSAG